MSPLPSARLFLLCVCVHAQQKKVASPQNARPFMPSTPQTAERQSIKLRKERQVIDDLLADCAALQVVNVVKRTKKNVAKPAAKRAAKSKAKSDSESESSSNSSDDSESSDSDSTPMVKSAASKTPRAAAAKASATISKKAKVDSDSDFEQ